MATSLTRFSFLFPQKLGAFKTIYCLLLQQRSSLQVLIIPAYCCVWMSLHLKAILISSKRLLNIHVPQPPPSPEYHYCCVSSRKQVLPLISCCCLGQYHYVWLLKSLPICLSLSHSYQNNRKSTLQHQIHTYIPREHHGTVAIQGRQEGDHWLEDR